MRKAIHLSHTSQCRKLRKELALNPWCIGDGACGSSSCKHANVRSQLKDAHEVCRANYNDRFLKLGITTSRDGKSAAAGHEKENS